MSKFAHRNSIDSKPPPTSKTRRRRQLRLRNSEPPPKSWSQLDVVTNPRLPQDFRSHLNDVARLRSPRKFVAYETYRTRRSRRAFRSNLNDATKLCSPRKFAASDIRHRAGWHLFPREDTRTSNLKSALTSTKTIPTPRAGWHLFPQKRSRDLAPDGTYFHKNDTETSHLMALMTPKRKTETSRSMNLIPAKTKPKHRT